MKRTAVADLLAQTTPKPAFEVVTQFMGYSQRQAIYAGLHREERKYFADLHWKPRTAKEVFA